MIELRVRPLALGVAISTLGSQRTQMFVVGFVATIALRGQLQSCRWRRVAAFTLCGPVLAAQGIGGVAVVIERGSPRFHPMARVATIPQEAFVLVVLFVAAYAGCGHAFVFVRHVAGRALYFRMATLQLEFSVLVVVKANVFPSAGRAHDMAGFALRTQAALVHIIFTMATVAEFGSFTILFVRRVTTFTLDRFVRTVQSILGQTVVLETGLVKFEDVGRASLVVGVTGSAGRALLLAVQTALLL